MSYFVSWTIASQCRSPAHSGVKHPGPKALEKLQFIPDFSYRKVSSRPVDGARLSDTCAQGQCPQNIPKLRSWKHCHRPFWVSKERQQGNWLVHSSPSLPSTLQSTRNRDCGGNSGWPHGLTTSAVGLMLLPTLNRSPPIPALGARDGVMGPGWALVGPAFLLSRVTETIYLLPCMLGLWFLLCAIVVRCPRSERKPEVRTEASCSRTTLRSSSDCRK